MFSCKILDSHFSLLHFNDLVQFHSQIFRDYKKHVFNIKNLFTTMGAIAHWVGFAGVSFLEFLRVPESAKSNFGL